MYCVAMIWVNKVQFCRTVESSQINNLPSVSHNWHKIDKTTLQDEDNRVECVSDINNLASYLCLSKIFCTGRDGEKGKRVIGINLI